MIHPVSSLDERRPAAGDRMGQTHPVTRAAVLDLLLQRGRVEEADRRDRPIDALAREDLVLQILWAELAEAERDLVVDLTGAEDASGSAMPSRRAAILIPSP
jgi:hypothetical protein